MGEPVNSPLALCKMQSQGSSTELQTQPLSPLWEGLQRESHQPGRPPGLLWPVIGEGRSSQEENKNHKKKNSFNAYL